VNFVGLHLSTKRGRYESSGPPFGGIGIRAGPEADSVKSKLGKSGISEALAELEAAIREI
jgi:hypothetical protein